MIRHADDNTFVASSPHHKDCADIQLLRTQKIRDSLHNYSAYEQLPRHDSMHISINGTNFNAGDAPCRSLAICQSANILMPRSPTTINMPDTAACHHEKSSTYLSKDMLVPSLADPAAGPPTSPSPVGQSLNTAYISKPSLGGAVCLTSHMQHAISATASSPSCMQQCTV